MEPSSKLLFDWAGQTILHPLGLAAALLLGVAMILCPRRLAPVTMLILACFVSSRQRIAVAGLDFDLMRILVLFGWTRVLLTGEMRAFQWKAIDSVLALWVVCGTIAYSVLHGTAAAFVQKLGESFDALGMYFLLRCLLRDRRDVEAVVVACMALSIPVALGFIVEKATGRNVFSMFGGVPEYTVVREGTLRAQGAFAHPILAGCFWAVLLPMFVGYWFATKNWLRMLVPLGVVAVITIIVACASSTPVLAAVVGLGAVVAFPLRRWMQYVRWGTVACLLGLHVVMNAPVWHLISRIDVVGGSTGWHRYHLIDQTIRRLPEWWLIGTKSTANWGYHLHDVTNQFVFEAVRGGLLTFVLFVLLIVLAFRGVGRACRAERDRGYRIEYWSFGAALFVHCACFMAVSYYGQILLVWFLTLAIIGSMTPVRSGALNAARGTHSTSHFPQYMQGQGVLARPRLRGGLGVP